MSNIVEVLFYLYICMLNTYLDLVQNSMLRKGFWNCIKEIPDDHYVWPSGGYLFHK